MLLSSFQYLINSLKFNIKHLSHILSSRGIKPMLDRPFVWDTKFRMYPGQSNHPQFLVYQMLLLRPSPILHLNHPNRKLISSRRNNIALLPSYGCLPPENPICTHNSDQKEPLQADLTPYQWICLWYHRKFRPVIAKSHSLSLEQPACRIWSVKASHLFPVYGNSEGPPHQAKRDLLVGSN